MLFRRRRIIEPEILDDQPPEKAFPSLKDLVRINRLTGGHNVLGQTFRRLALPDEAFTVLDVGSATGDAAVELKRAFPRATVFSFDYRHHHVVLSPPPRLVGDAFALPFRPASVDFVYCGLFLHHFTNEQIVQLLRDFGGLATRAVIVNDLERHLLAYYFLPLTRFVFRWDKITLHDGPISVQAAFTRSELVELARRAGLHDIDVRVHRPAFRLSMSARGGR
jgi:SAM-dependent methyltransferase